MIGSIIIALIVILFSVSVFHMSGDKNFIIVVLGLALPLLFYFSYDKLANYFYLLLNKIKNN